MKLKIEIKMDNSAFEGEGEETRSGAEAARILRGLANQLDGQQIQTGDASWIRDINGNRCGQAEVSD